MRIVREGMLPGSAGSRATRGTGLLGIRPRSGNIPAMNRFLIVAALAASSSVAGAQAVTVTLSEWKVAMARDTVRAGSVTFRVTNGGFYEQLRQCERLPVKLPLDLELRN